MPCWAERFTMDTTVGTCSECGGRVTLPAAWMGMNPPIPTCQSCGAREKQPHGPVIEMEKSDRIERHKKSGLYSGEIELGLSSSDRFRQILGEDAEIERYEAACKGG